MRRLLLLLASLLALPAAAQSPTIWIDPGAGAAQPVALREARYDIRMHGFVASTRVELVFHNPNDRVFEGELVFPLADGQAVTGYALEVDGALREGVVVPKETARVAFEDITRRGIDPGLAELTQGNVFRTRLYPIPARGDKRVVVRFDQPLVPRAGSHRYVLPLQYDRPLQHLHVRAEAVGEARAPTVQSAPDALAFDRWRQSWVAELDRRDIQPRRELVIDLPAEAAGARLFATADPDAADWHMFIAQVDTVRPARLPTLPAARRIVLFYDASGSARDRDRARELAALADWWSTLDQAEIDLVAFRDAAEAPRRFRIEHGDGSALRAAIEALPLDGGSSYGALRIDPSRGYDLALLVGDGLSNFGGDEPQLVPAGARAPRVVALHAAQQVDTARLARIAQRHGGTVVDLRGAEPSSFAARLRESAWQLVALDVLDGECTDLGVEAPTPVGAALDLAGRCRGEARLRLRFAGGGRQAERVLALRDATPLPGADGDVVRRLWATAAIARLERSATPDPDRALALATRHAVVTARTSLLVLERIEDYVRWRVPPHEPELRASYDALLAAQPVAANPKVARKAHLERIAAAWAEFRTWHGTRHATLDAAMKERARTNTAGRSVSGGTVADAAAPAERARPQREEARPVAAAPAPMLAAAPAAAPATDAEMLAEPKRDDDAAAPPAAAIELAPWDPQTPWLEALRNADDPYAAYLAQRERHAGMPAFFVDCADWFRDRAKDPVLARRVLSNLAEIDVESAPLLRVLAYRLQHWGEFALAVPLFERVLVLRGEEPQSRRDLALALSRQPAPDFVRAAELLWSVVEREWDPRFPDVQLIALHELGDVVVRAAAARPAVDLGPELDRLGVDTRLREPLPVALRVVLSWDADNTDVDLWVTDPAGETAIYSHPRTRIGGHLSRDFTGGYGPEVFTIARAQPGTYVVEAHYFGDRVQKLTGAATLQAEFLTGFATRASARQVATRRLEGDGDRIEVGRFTVDASD